MEERKPRKTFKHRLSHAFRRLSNALICCQGQNEDILLEEEEEIPEREKPVQVNFQKLFKQEWNAENTKTLESLREGIFGPVQICENNTNHHLALEKVIPKDRADQDYLNKELRCLELCRGHSNILNLIAFSEAPESYHIYLETFPSLPLGKLDANKMSPFILDTILKNTRKALVYIHSRGIIHRQITGDNILVSHFPEVKISGFDIATIARKGYGCVGVVGYIAPEVVNHSFRYVQLRTGCNDFDQVAEMAANSAPYTYKADYYSLGVTLFELLFNEIPALMDLDTVRDDYKEDAILLNMYEGHIRFPVEKLENPGNFTIFRRHMEDLLNESDKDRCIRNMLRRDELFDILLNSESHGTVTDIEACVKDGTPHDRERWVKVWHDPSSQFVHRGDTKDIFYYLATRPSSLDFWNGRIDTFYKSPYDEYIAHWNQVSTTAPATDIQIEVEVIANPEDAEGDASTSTSLIPQHVDGTSVIIVESDSSSSISVVSPEEDVAQVQEEDSSHSTAEILEAVNAIDVAASTNLVLEEEDIIQINLISSSAENSPHATVEIVESDPVFQEAEITSSGGDNLFVSIILWILFVTLCIIFFFKSLCNKLIRSVTSIGHTNGQEDDSAGTH